MQRSTGLFFLKWLKAPSLLTLRLLLLLGSFGVTSIPSRSFASGVGAGCLTGIANGLREEQMRIMQEANSRYAADAARASSTRHVPEVPVYPNSLAAVDRLLARSINAESRKSFETRWNRLEIEAQDVNWKRLRHLKKGELEEVDFTRRKLLLDHERMDPSTTIYKEAKEGGLKPYPADDNWQRADRRVSEYADQGLPITEERLKEINRLVIWGESSTGKSAPPVRKDGHELFTAKGEEFSYLRGGDAQAAFENFFSWYAHAEPVTNPIELAAQAYQRLASYHVFRDGEGRTDRLVVDWILQSHGLPPAAIKIEEVSVAVFGSRRDHENQSPEAALEAVTHGIERTLAILKKQ